MTTLYHPTASNGNAVYLQHETGVTARLLLGFLNSYKLPNYSKWSDSPSLPDPLKDTERTRFMIGEYMIVTNTEFPGIRGIYTGTGNE
jgi:hypothetical protein